MSAACIYFVQVEPDGPIKIGWTRGLVVRVLGIKTNCPYPVKVIGFIANAGPAKEATIHAMFAADRIHGEWFRPTPELTAYVQRHTRPWKPKPKHGIDHFNATLDDGKVIEIRRRYGRGEPIGGLAKEFGVTTSTIKSVTDRRTWKHVG